MSQISRPFQIALVVLVLLVGVWFVALRGHSSGTGGSSASASAPQTQTPAQPPAGSSPADTGTVYHGSAPGVGGLTRAIAKARGAVAQSQQNARQLQEKSNQASSVAATQAAAASTAASAANAKSQTTATARSGAPVTSPKTSAAAKTAAASNMQATVEGELKQNKVVLILFWNPKSAVDMKVHNEVSSLAHQLGGKVAVHYAQAGQVGLFGSFTRTVQVYGTPTVLIVNKKAEATSIAGLTDVFALKQAITEAQSA